MSEDTLVFGTYRLKQEVLDIAIGMAMHCMTQHGIAQPLLDTAVMYNNSPSILRAIEKYPNARVGTKLHRLATLHDDLASQSALYGDRLHRVLLHKPMPLTAYMELVTAKAKGVVRQIGVSNYQAAQLAELLADLQRLDEAGELPLPFDQAKPDVVQNEFHPFLRTTVPEVCRSNGIHFEGHSVFSFLDEYPRELLDSAAPTVGQMALAFALQRGGGGAVFNTANYWHLLENLDVVALDELTLARLDAVKTTKCYARYAGADTAAFQPIALHTDPANGSGFEALSHHCIRTVIAPQLRADLQAVDGGEVPGKTANGIPRMSSRPGARRDALVALSEALFVCPETGGPVRFHAEDAVRDRQARIAKLGQAMTKIRRALHSHAKEMKRKAKPLQCKLRAIEDPQALPVDIPDAAVIQPFIELLAATRELPTTALRAQRGVLFPDGRLDFCKQVAQPLFEEFCRAVLRSGVVKHFLIGNNVALAGDTDGKREAALTHLIRNAAGIQTWYLAGNAIGKQQIKSIADAIAASPDSRFVWLKMNPIQTGSVHLGRMLVNNPRIALLDLFNTGLCNEGLAALGEGVQDAMAEVADGARPGLQHLYLDINAISDGAALARVVALFPQLESLSANVNQLGDDGLRAFRDHLFATAAAAPRLQRLVLGSNALSDASLPLLVDIVQRIPTITVLQLGSYKSTAFFQQRANTLSDFDKMLDLARALAANMKKSGTPAHNFFGFQNAYAGDDVQRLVLAAEAMGLYCDGSQIGVPQQPTLSSKQPNKLLRSHRSWQPPPVEFIQSVYRNTM